MNRLRSDRGVSQDLIPHATSVRSSLVTGPCCSVVGDSCSGLARFAVQFAQPGAFASANLGTSESQNSSSSVTFSLKPGNKVSEQKNVLDNDKGLNHALVKYSQFHLGLEYSYSLLGVT